MTRGDFESGQRLSTFIAQTSFFVVKTSILAAKETSVNQKASVLCAEQGLWKQQ